MSESSSRTVVLRWLGGALVVAGIAAVTIAAINRPTSATNDDSGIAIPGTTLPATTVSTTTTLLPTTTSTTQDSTTSLPSTSTTTTAGPVVVDVFPGDDLGALALANPPGTRFLIKAGVHRMQSVEPKNAQSFIGEAGAVLDGSTVLTGFDATDNGLWVVTGQTQGPGPQRGVCDGSYAACVFPEMLFIDGVPLVQVIGRAQVRPGTWMFNYSADRIFIADDPTGRVVETSFIAHAFSGTATGVEIRGLTVTKYASPAQVGAIRAALGADWIVEDNEVSYNAAVGIHLGNGSLARGNFAHHNGEKGFSARGDSVRIIDNEISDNNIGGFRSLWAAGGSKFVNCTNLEVRGNYVHDNNGPGLWTDVDCKGIVMEDNRIENNAGPGIRIEISRDAVVRGNTVSGNGWDWGAGISVDSSPNVEVSGNVLADDNILVVQVDRGSGDYGPHIVEDLWVHDNTLSWTDGRTGMLTTLGDDSIFTSKNNRFDQNTYGVIPAEDAFQWFNLRISAENWVDFGNDINGVFTPSLTLP